MVRMNDPGLKTKIKIKIIMISEKIIHVNALAVPQQWTILSWLDLSSKDSGIEFFNYLSC